MCEVQYQGFQEAFFRGKIRFGGFEQKIWPANRMDSPSHPRQERGQQRNSEVRIQTETGTFGGETN